MLIKLLACMGLVWILKDSYILIVPRTYLKKKSKHLEEFLSCSLCLGFWVGLSMAYIEYKENFSINYIYYPLAVSAFCWFFDSALDMIQEIWIYFKNIREKS